MHGVNQDLLRMPVCLLVASLLGGSTLAHGHRNLPRPRSPVEAVPVWRHYTKEKPPPTKRYVFLDEDTAEYVVYFPESLKTGQADEGRMILFRFRPQYIVAPTVRASVSREDDDALTYEYDLHNADFAKDAIRWFFLVLPLEVSPTKVDHKSWRPSRTDDYSQPVAPQAALVQNDEIRDPKKMGKFVYWTCGDLADPLAPGTSLKGFRISSRALPGITTAYATTGKVLRTPFEIPPEVMDQIVPLLIIENNYKAVATIGPKFDAVKATVTEIARDYHQSISHIVNDGWIEDTEYVREMKAILDGVAKSGRRAPIRYRVLPKTFLEGEIGKAIIVALGTP
jgi:hypothetical protein